MRRERQFNPTGHLVMGLLIVALGVMFTLDNLGLLDARQILQYWPVILIMIGVGKVSQAEASGGRFGGGILILIGSLFLIQKLGFLHVNIWSLWPLLLVIIGIRMIVERGSVRVIADTSPGAATSPASSPALDTSSTTSAIAILSQVDRKITSQAFQHAEITAFMGGGKLDLRDANLAGGQAVIHVMVMMGGFELLVPASWNVIIELTPIMAGVDDRRRASAPSVDAPRLFLRGIAVMGGIEVKD
jgi:predicted membrane protein